MENSSNLTKWFIKPKNLTKSFVIVLPLILSQVLQRLFPIVDNRYISELGSASLYINNIQYNFITLGQFIGIATYISSLVFWRRSECVAKQGNILIKHLSIVGVFTTVLAAFCWFYAGNIVSFYQVDSAYIPLATAYLKVGLINMVLQAIYGGIDGVLVGASKQVTSMIVAGLLVLGNIICDYYAVYHLSSAFNSMMMIGISSIVMLSMCIITMLNIACKSVKGWEKIKYKDIFVVWSSELGTYLIRGIVPFIYAYQLNYALTQFKILTSYQLALHISYVFCFPLVASMQLAIRDSVASPEADREVSQPPKWWNVFLYTGLLPTTILLVLGVVYEKQLLSFFYNYITPDQHICFLALFFASCIIGQFGNAITIPLRVAKKNYLVTRNFLIAEMAVMLGGTEILIQTNQATPMLLGCVLVLFTVAYASLNYKSLSKLEINKLALSNENAV